MNKTNIQEYLEDKKLDNIVKEYGMMEFFVNVLDIRRTFVDKLLAVKRHVICGTINKKVRHIYDVKRLLEQEEVRKLLADPADINAL